MPRVCLQHFHIISCLFYLSCRTLTSYTTKIHIWRCLVISSKTTGKLLPTWIIEDENQIISWNPWKNKFHRTSVNGSEKLNGLFKVLCRNIMELIHFHVLSTHYGTYLLFFHRIWWFYVMINRVTQSVDDHSSWSGGY